LVQFVLNEALALSADAPTQVKKAKKRAGWAEQCMSLFTLMWRTQSIT
jgi:hypothetical protein